MCVYLDNKHINKEITSLNVLVHGLRQRKYGAVVESNRGEVGGFLGGAVIFGRRQPGEYLVEKQSKYELGAFKWMEGRPARQEHGE